MKKLIFLIAFMFLASQVWATNYYVNSASSGGDGTTTATSGATAAFATVAAAQAALTGDQSDNSLLFNKGQTWREQFTVGAYGTAGHPFTIGAYGTGENPIISGANILTGFDASASGPVKTEYQESVNVDQSFRNSAGLHSMAQGFEVDTTGTVASIQLTLLKVGSPTGNLWVEIQTNSSGVPSNTPVSNGTSATIDIATLTTSRAWYTFTFAVPPTVTADTVYFIVIRGDNAISATDYPRWTFYASDVYRTGVAAYNRGYTQSADSPYSWTVRTDSDHAFRLYLEGVEATTYEKASVITEPKSVFYNGVKLTEDPEATVACAQNKWDWASNVLYVNVGEDPDSGTLEAAQRNYGIVLNQDYVTIDGLDVAKPQNSGIVVWSADSSDYNTIQNCTLTYAPNFGWKAGIALNHASHNLITNNTVTDCYLGIVLSSYHASESYPTDSNTVSHNTVLRIDSSGIGASAGSATAYQLKDNIIEHNDVSLCSQTFDDTAGILLSRAGTGNIIRYNKSYTNGLHPVTMRGSGIMVDENSNGNSVYYNIVYGNTSSGISTSGDDTIIYNNALYDNTQGVFLFLSGITGDSPADCLIKNNIIVADGDQSYVFVRSEAVSAGGHVFDYNIYYGSSKENPFSWDSGGAPADDHTWAQWQEHNPEAHSAVADPLFVSATNFHLQPTSPARRAGTDVSLTTDYSGRPVFNPPSMGAYEYHRRVIKGRVMPGL